MFKFIVSSFYFLINLRFLSF